MRSILEDESLFDVIILKKDKYTRPEKKVIAKKNQFGVYVKNESQASYKKSPLKNVVIKNIGNMNISHLKNALNYVEKTGFNFFDEEKIFINELSYNVDYDELMRNWNLDLIGNEKTKVAMHLVFSIDEVKSEENLKILSQSVQETLVKNLSEYKFASVIHVHQGKPHVHVILNKMNIFTNKRIRFSAKGECKAFFSNLREDFKENLNYYSNGRFEYSNSPVNSMEKYERQISKIKKIESELDNNNFNFEDFTSPILIDIDKKITSLSIKESNLKNSLAPPKNFHSKLEYIKNAKAQLDNKKKNIYEFEKDFHKFKMNMSLFEKKKFAVLTLEKNKNLLNRKNLFTMIALKKEIQSEVKSIKNDFKILVDTFSSYNNIRIANLNSYVLNNELKKNKMLKHMSELYSPDDKNAIDKNKNDIINLLLIRHTKLQDLLLKKIKEKNIQSLDFLLDENIKEYKELIYIVKELKFAKNILYPDLKKENISINKNIKNENLECKNEFVKNVDSKSPKKQNNIKDSESIIEKNNKAKKESQHGLELSKNLKKKLPSQNKNDQYYSR